MGRRLLFFPILRTRSARKVLVGGSVIVLPALFGCENTAPTSAPDPAPATRPSALPAAAQRELEQVVAEAGIEVATDPAPPSGDLRGDVEAFTTLDACVRARTLSDALLGDAIDALGYDTLTRDACRILQALKEKKTNACKPIASTALRERCETYVAVVNGDASSCPTSGSGRFAARDPVCLARASRDEHLCAAALVTERARCRALVLGKKSECGRDDACVRQVERFKSLFERPASRPAPPAHLHVEIAEKGTPKPVTQSFDLDDVAAAGAVVRTGQGATRVSLGAPKNALWPAADAPQATPKLFVEVSGAPSAKKGAVGGDLRLDLLVPKTAILSAVLASDTKITIDQLSVDPGGPIKFVVESTLREAPRNFRLKLDVETFVRERASGTEPLP